MELDSHRFKRPRTPVLMLGVLLGVWLPELILQWESHWVRLSLDSSASLIVGTCPFTWKPSWEFTAGRKPLCT